MDGVQVAEVHSHGTMIVLKQFLTILSTKLNHLMAVCMLDGAFVELFDEGTDSIFLFKYLGDWLPRLEIMLKTEALSVKYLFLKIASSIGNLLFGVAKGEKREALSCFYYGLLGEKLITTIQALSGHTCCCGSFNLLN